MFRSARKKPRNKHLIDELGEPLARIGTAKREANGRDRKLDRSQQEEQGERIIPERSLPARRLVAVKRDDLVERVVGDFRRAGLRGSEEEKARQKKRDPSRDQDEGEPAFHQKRAPPWPRLTVGFATKACQAAC